MKHHYYFCKKYTFTLAKGATHVGLLKDHRKVAFTLAEGATHVGLSKDHRKVAFTLAEVLITLGIIGIVAALTMPALINNIRQKHFKSLYKKAFSELSQVVQKLDDEYGGSYTGECETFDDECFRDLFAEKMQVVEKCYSTAPNKCQETSQFLNGEKDIYSSHINYAWPSLVTKSGYTVKFRFHQKNCESFISQMNLNIDSCGWVQIDVNGLKKPNTVGKDIFLIDINKNKLFPKYTGTNIDLSTIDKIKNDCKNGTGLGCAYLYLNE